MPIYFIMVWLDEKQVSGGPKIERVIGLDQVIKRIGELGSGARISVYKAENILDWS